MARVDSCAVERLFLFGQRITHQISLPEPLDWGQPKAIFLLADAVFQGELLSGPLFYPSRAKEHPVPRPLCRIRGVVHRESAPCRRSIGREQPASADSRQRSDKEQSGEQNAGHAGSLQCLQRMGRERLAEPCSNFPTGRPDQVPVRHE
jgi:hypothetical protein